MIAYLRVIPPGTNFDEGSIGRVVVHPKWRRQGFAKKWMRLAMELVKTEFSGGNILILVRAYLQSFYHDFGFETVSDVVMEERVEHYQMLYQGATIK